jgi:hypothetical protein
MRTLPRSGQTVLALIGTRIGEPALSEILAGKRPMGRKTIEALARFFRVEPGLFLARDADSAP